MLAAVAAHASVLDATSRARLATASRHTSRADEEQPPYIPLLIMVDDDHTVDALENIGTIVHHRRGDILACSFPRDRIEDLDTFSGIVAASSSEKSMPLLNNARSSAKVELVHAGTSLPQPFDGSGVVVGITDVGFDARHIAFSKCLRRICNYDPANAEAVRMDASELGDWTADCTDQTHATHVAGILAGGFDGNAYYGVAPGADLVATTSSLSDVGLICGVEDIIAYAKAEGKPAVINMSVGSFIGPHDGSDLTTQYLDRCTDDAIICMSAGNNGDKKYNAFHTFTADAPVVRVGYTSNGSSTDVEGYVDIWSDDDSTFEVAVGVYDWETDDVIYTTPWYGSQEKSVMISPATHPEWGNYFDGVQIIEMEKDHLNGRFHAIIATSTLCEERCTQGWIRYRSVFAFRSSPGTSISIYSDASTSHICKFGIPDEAKYSSNNSFSGLAVSPGIISVGSYNTRDEIFLIDGSTKSFPSLPAGQVSSFSSYGTDRWGNVYPDICAPGAFIVSATSTPYVDDGHTWYLAFSQSVDGSDYYWHNDSGTSMSSPFFAGVVALWLQADPTLTAADILDIARRTADKSVPGYNASRWGAGAVDALAGLRYILGISGVADIPIADGEATTCYFDLAGRRIPSEPTAPGVYISRSGSQSTTFIVR